jgi:hypothetical protein
MRYSAPPEGTPDSLQDLSGAPPDCPVVPQVRAPTVEPKRLGDVAGAPDCPVRLSTEAIPNGHFGGWGYKYLQPPHIYCIQVFSIHTSYKSYSIQYKKQTKRSNPLPSPESLQTK